MPKFRAAVLKEFGGKFEISHVEVKPPQGFSAEVEVRAVGVCGRDLVVWKGGFRNLRPPLILGHEVFGLYRGRPVGVYPAIVGEKCKLVEPHNLCTDYMILGENTPGGYAERVYVPEWNIIELPDEEFSKYAAAVCGVATFIHASRLAGVSSGEKVLVTGASGGVAIHGIQYLASLGAEVIAYTRSQAKAEVLRSLGVNVVSSLDFYKESGRVDHVMETVGAPTINRSIRSLKPGGTLVLIGNVTGEPIVLERPALVVMREVRIVGSAAYTRDEYAEAVRIVGEGNIRPFYKEYRLESINEAYMDIVGGKVVGRAVLVV